MINIPPLNVGDRYISRNTGIIFEVYLMQQGGYHGFYYYNEKRKNYFCPNNDDLKADWNEFFELLPAGNTQ